MKGVGDDDKAIPAEERDGGRMGGAEVDKKAA